MTILLDLNVLLDAFLGREPWRAAADAIWDANRDGRISGQLSAAALPTLFYVIRKQCRPAADSSATQNPNVGNADSDRRNRLATTTAVCNACPIGPARTGLHVEAKGKSKSSRVGNDTSPRSLPVPAMTEATFK